MKIKEEEFHFTSPVAEENFSEVSRPHPSEMGCRLKSSIYIFMTSYEHVYNYFVYTTTRILSFLKTLIREKYLEPFK